MKKLLPFTVLAFLFASRLGAPAQIQHSAAAPNQVYEHTHPYLHASHIIVPQARPIAPEPAGTVTIAAVNVAVDIVEQVATTTMEISLTNATGRRLEAQMIVPVPDKAALRGFIFQGAASEPTAQLLPRGEARKLYDEIVAKTRDPALLEFIGHSLIRSSVFPVEPRAGPDAARQPRDGDPYELSDARYGRPLRLRFGEPVLQQQRANLPILCQYPQWLLGREYEPRFHQHRPAGE